MSQVFNVRLTNRYYVKIYIVWNDCLRKLSDMLIFFSKTICTQLQTFLFHSALKISYFIYKKYSFILNIVFVNIDVSYFRKRYSALNTRFRILCNAFANIRLFFIWYNILRNNHVERVWIFLHNIIKIFRCFRYIHVYIGK